jgi:nitrous oxidase accessory protein
MGAFAIPIAIRRAPWPNGVLLVAGLFGPIASATAHPAFQALVDAAKPGTVLEPPPGIYEGPVTLDKPLVIDGHGQVTIDSGGKGSVILLRTNGATLKGLRLTNSGESHNDIDAGVQVRGSFNIVEDNRIDNCLFGIDLQQSEDNVVRRNRISSKPVDLGIRGDAIRLWYSFRNRVTDNVIRDSRDTVVWYSRDNLIAHNDARHGRYSLHFMYAQHNEVLDNHYEDNSVGIFLMYSDGVVIKRNYIAKASGPTGIGIGFKETSDVTVEGNEVLHNAVGLYLDVSPYQPDTTNSIRDNLVAYNGIGVRFLNDWQGNIFEGNRFKGNITQVSVESGKTAQRNLWSGNYWDDYEGFDRDRNGIGDTPYQLYGYADRIWMDVPPAQLFKGSPMLEALDFLERLAPFSDPNLTLRDPRPLMTAEVRAPSRDEAPAKAEEAPGARQEGKRAPGFDALDALQRSLGREQ